MVKMLKSSNGIVDNTEERISNVRRKIQVLRKNQKEMLEIKNTVKEREVCL